MQLSKQLHYVGEVYNNCFISHMVQLNSPPLNFPHSTGTNLFLTGTNYARTFQDVEKINKDGVKPDGIRLRVPLIVI